MKVVIVGGGEIGQNLAHELAERKDNEISIIEKDEKRGKEIAEDLDALILTGDGTDPEMLRKAGLEEAEALVAVTGSDALNTVIAMLGKRFEVSKIVVQLNGPGLWAACEEIGVTRIIAPKMAATTNILATLYDASRLDLSLLGRGGLRVAEIEIGEGAEEKINSQEPPEGVLVVAVQRDGEVHLPKKVEFKNGDLLVLLVEDDDALEQLKRDLSSSTD